MTCTKKKDYDDSDGGLKQVTASCLVTVTRDLACMTFLAITEKNEIKTKGGFVVDRWWISHLSDVQNSSWSLGILQV